MLYDSFGGPLQLGVVLVYIYHCFSNTRGTNYFTNVPKILLSSEDLVIVIDLGIGIPMMAANYIKGITVTLQSENGILGLVS